LLTKKCPFIKIQVRLICAAKCIGDQKISPSSLEFALVFPFKRAYPLKEIAWLNFMSSKVRLLFCYGLAFDVRHILPFLPERSIEKVRIYSANLSTLQA
jgi:hypothetical protein